jgi:hypothetical protein
MLENNTYNLMMQLTEEHKSLWRIKLHYMKDAENSEEARKFWTKMEKDKEEHINELTALIKEHMK